MRQSSKIALLAAFTFGALCAFAQTPTKIPLTGNLGSILGTPSPYASASIELLNCASPVSVTGYAGIVQTAMTIQADASGNINSTIWPNDVITCNGTTGASQYAVNYIVQGVPSGTTQCYQVTSGQSSWNMNVQQPVACGGGAPNPQDAQFRNLNVTGCMSIDGGTCGNYLSANGCTITTGGNLSCPGSITGSVISPTSPVGLAYGGTAATSAAAANANLSGMNPACSGSNCYYISEGDSTSACAYQTCGSTAWGAQLAAMPFFAGRATYIQAAVSGSSWESMTSRYNTAVRPYKPNGTTILKSYLSVLIGRNNVAESPATIEAGIQAYINQAKADGFTIIFATTLPASTAPGPPLTGAPVSITAFTPNTGNNTTVFTAANSFTIGQGLYLTNISAVPTETTPTCSPTSFSASSGTFATIQCANSFSANQWVYFSGMGGAAASFVNGSWIQVASTGLSGTQFQIPWGGGTISPESLTGTVYTSNGAGANLNNFAGTVTAANSTSFTMTPASGGTGANTGTANPTLASAWDPITLSQAMTLQAVNDWIRHFPVCSTTITTNCADFVVDFASQLRDPGNTGLDTYDGTHPTVSFAATMAQTAEAALLSGGPVLPAQPMNSQVYPNFSGGMNAGGIGVYPAYWNYYPSNDVMFWTMYFVGSTAWDDAYDATSGNYLQRNSRFYDWFLYCGSYSLCLTMGADNSATFTGTVTAPTVNATSMNATTISGTSANFSSVSGVIGGTGTATFSAGAGAGSGPSTPVCLSGFTCDSNSGVVAITSGTSPPTTGTVVNVTLGGMTRLARPTCLTKITTTAGVEVPSWGLANTTTVESINLVGTALTASTAYDLAYICQGN
jgi:hypothetical protein